MIETTTHESLIESFRLSPQQRHLCALPQPEGFFPYRSQVVALLQGPLVLARFYSSLSFLVERYEILRTSFPQLTGFALPTQVIHQDISLPLEVYDWRALSLREQAETLTRIQELLQKGPGHLTAGPAWRIVLIQCAPDRHWLVWDLAALSADIRTCHVLLEELSQRYRGQTAAEEDEPLQYADLAEWQYEVLATGETSDGGAYWRSIPFLQGSATTLPFERSSASQVRSFAPRSLMLELPSDLLARLQTLSEQLEVSPGSFLLGCWGVVLARLTVQSELLIGTGSAGRKYEALEKAVGLFAKMLPLSYRLQAGASFREIAQQVEQISSEGSQWQEYFSWQGVEGYQEGEEPFCPFGFTYEVLPVPWQCGELTWTVVQQQMYQDSFNICLNCLLGAQSLQVTLHYNQNSYAPPDMQRLLAYWHMVLLQVLANPDLSLQALQLLTEQEKYRLLVEWNATQTAFPAVAGIHQLFETQARLSPAAPALRCGELLLSYAQLARQTNRLAHLLRARGLQPGDRVALCLSRNHQPIIALLAVLKAGGIYVPLDMEVPPARLLLLLQEIAPALILSSQRLQDLLPSLSFPVLQMETLSQQLAEQPNTMPEQPTSCNLAYIMYTSGSTGFPKGVVIRQQSVSNYTSALCEVLGVQPGWHFATVSSLAADLGNTSIFCALASGGCIHVLPPELSTDGGALAAYVRQYPLDVLKIVPSHLQALLSAGASEILPRQRLILGGETLPWSLLEHIQQLQPACLLYNHYGPTETTVGAVVQPLGAAEQICFSGGEQYNGSVPIGRPIANIQVYLLDTFHLPVPQGVPGELYIGGTGLADGYWLRADLTAERFVPDPFSSVAGARLYRTGDLARYHSDGTLEFLGRLDNQVKLRGYRIELGEIEAVLAQHLLVKQTVVLLQHGGQTAEKHLIAHVVTGETQNSPQEIQAELRSFLQQRLPEYMLPAAFVLLGALPLTTNGKVDRRSLLALDWRQLQPRKAEEHEQPLSQMEELVLLCWRRVLQVELGPHDNFFEVGGHSLLATQVVARLQRVTGIEVPLQMLFEAPTVAELALQLTRKMQQGTNSFSNAPIVPFPRTQSLPLSFAQQRLWFLDQLEPGSVAYILPRAVRLYGQLDPVALEQALALVIRRHENLRTTFPTWEGEPIQQIADEPTTHLAILDLRLLPQTERERQARLLAAQEAEQPFDLGHGPLVRYWLLLLEEENQILLLTMHHIISDGWSSGILVKELTTLYASLQRGEMATLPELPIQYADYALWQRSWLQGEVLQQQLNYWKRQLEGITPLQLPLDYPRPPVQTFRGDRQHLLIPLDMSQQLQELSQREGATLFMTLLAAFQLLLARYSGQSDIAVGTPIANRTREETEGLIGFFVNTLVLRTSFVGNPSFLGLLARVRTMCLEAYAQQDLPFEQVVEALQPERDRSRSPLFQVLFALPNIPHQAVEELPVRIESFAFELSATKFDLNMVVVPSARGLRVTLEYNTDLFAATTISSMLTHWQSLLQAILNTPEQPANRLLFLTRQEEEQQLFEWNTPSKPLPALTVRQLFEEQVRSTPDAIAVIGDEEQLTYAVLNQSANQLAHYLRHQGVEPDTLVGICLPHTPHLLIALLAVLKANGAYLPLDPAYPAARLHMMVEDAGLTLLLTQQRLQERLPQNAPQVFYLDRDWQHLCRYKSTNPASEVRGMHLAYVIYTSGSTGQPKGAMITQKGFLNYVQWSSQTYAVACGAPSPVHSSISFDLTVTSLFPALISGSGVRLQVEEQNIPALACEVSRSTQMSVLKITPSGLEALNQLLEKDELAERVRVLVIGGEALTADLLQDWQAYAPGTRVVNEYGPTETVVGCCVYEVDMTKALPRSIPIGRPIANTQLYVLDDQLQLVPAGVEGELYIGGTGLARGYLGRAEQTAERFVPHPFSVQGGERLYRTGDRARYQKNGGTLEYLGRKDEQVKLRGYRIELGEIEGTLAEHERVKQSVVLLQGNERDEQQLVAYVVGVQGRQSVSQGELRAFLKNRLPEYMLPAQFVLLESLPLTPNGKVDRHNLPMFAASGTEPGTSTEEKSFLDPVQELVLHIFQEVLEREQIGLEENFFEIGGHSLRAIQVISRLNRRFGVKLPPGVVFEAPTVPALASRMQKVLRQHQGLTVPEIVPAPRSQDLPLSFAQQRLWFLNLLHPGNPAYNISIAVRLQGDLHVAALRQSMLTLIQRHESLRTFFTERDGQAFQRIAAQAIPAFVVIDLRSIMQAHRVDEVQRLVDQEAQQPFDLSTAPLLRALLLKQDDQDYVLVLTMHHIVSDGWSMSILVRELTAFYHAFAAGEASPLPPLPVQYADYAIWQRQWLKDEVLKEQVRYWINQLSEARALKLPTDYPRPAVRRNHGDRYNFLLDSQLAQELGQLSRQEGATLFMTLLTAFQILLSRLSGEQDVVVGTDSANRSYLETEGLIGFFVNLLALRTNLSGNPRFVNLLHTVREMVLKAYMYQEMPFEMIVEHLRLLREEDRTPLINVLFVMQNLPTTRTTLAGIRLQPFNRKSSFAKFDLALFLFEGDQGLHGSINYDADLFQEETIALLAERYEALLRSIVAQPNGQIAGLAIITDEEKAHQDRQRLTLHQNLKLHRGERHQLVPDEAPPATTEHL